jgi:phosphatidylinositol 4-kinase A
MIDVSRFLLRWMFLSNLCRDIAEIQTLPTLILSTAPPVQHKDSNFRTQGQQFSPNQESMHSTDSNYYSNLQQQQPHIVDDSTIELHSTRSINHVDANVQHPQQPYIPTQSHPRQSLTILEERKNNEATTSEPPQAAVFSTVSDERQQSKIDSRTPPRNSQPQDDEVVFKEQCWRGILSYPSGSVQRIMMIDALREELVQQLIDRIRKDEHTITKYQQQQSNQPTNTMDAVVDSHSLDKDEATKKKRREPGMQHGLDDTIVTTPVLKHDTVTFDDMEKNGSHVGTDDDESWSQQHTDNDKQDTQQHPEQSDTLLTLRDYVAAKRSLLLARNYLPQLVAAVLKSPPPFDEYRINPIQKLRQFLISQCLNDASVGIELCWLLEAEVGRTWKSLFEHRQQTGRRLIIVLPADKAVVLAKIGSEKREAFDLLQDAEQATAYGYTATASTRSNNFASEYFNPQQQSFSTDANDQNNIDTRIMDFEHHTRLPSSLSVRRCSHFGDTMQFIDRLSKISSDLRMIPSQHRYEVLHEHLHELNRRLRRRMVTRGGISLDVEDHRSVYDWPHIHDMSVDMIQHSVHLPLMPQIKSWPNGEPKVQDNNDPSFELSMPNTEVVRVLNIVVQESKLLSSRERCPFLIHVEVADSGLEGSDARLYTMGSTDLGSTVGETLGILNSVGAAFTEAVSSSSSRVGPFIAPRNIVPYGIPDELLQNIPVLSNTHHMTGIRKDEQTQEEIEYNSFPRGGSQTGGHYYDNHDVFSGGYTVDPFDLVRQQEYEQLHHHLHAQRNILSQPSPILPPAIPNVSLGSDLLDKVFGREWRAKCKEIRDASPYGHIKGWRLASFLLKAGEDIRREAFVMQIISKLQSWFRDEIPDSDRPFMRPYTIMCVGGDAGLLECLSDAKSFDEIKKRTDGFTTLRDYFERAYGRPRQHHHGHTTRPPLDTFGLSKVISQKNGHISFETAQDNFLRSLVGYSLVCYILQIKDRHNANILLDRVGHIMHIDFGFVLGDTPKMGKVPIFSERAPFKLSGDFWDVLGGWNIGAGGLGVKFCKMFELAFQCASAHADEIAALTEATMLSLDSNPRNARSTANGVRSRLRMRGVPGSREQKLFVMDLVNAALTSWGTSTYDWLQRNMNGYQ